MKATKRKCPVCGMIEWSTSRHTGAIHDRIRAARGGKLRRALGRRSTPLASRRRRR